MMNSTSWLLTALLAAGTVATPPAKLPVAPVVSVAPPVVAPPAATSLFRVGPGDVLRIDVWQEPAISGRFAVGSSGAIEHPLIGSFAVAGKTADEISTGLRNALRDGFIRDPRVAVEIAEHRSFRVSVVGAVKAPGIQFLKEPADLFTVIMMSGGLSETPAGMVTVLRAGGGTSEPGVLNVDLGAYLRTGDASQNIAVQPGDLIFVPSGGAMPVDPRRGVTVVGEVKSPGVYEVSATDTVLSLVLRAGGATEFASRNATKVYRSSDGKRLEVRLADILDHGERKKDVDLHPGDLVVVPARRF